MLGSCDESLFGHRNGWLAQNARGHERDVLFCLFLFCLSVLVLCFWWPFAPVSWATCLYVCWSSVVHTTVYCRAYLIAHSCIHWSSCLHTLIYRRAYTIVHSCVHESPVLHKLIYCYAYLIVHSCVHWSAIVHTLVYRCAYTIVHSCVHWSAVIAVHTSICTLVCCRTLISLRCLCINEPDAVHTKLCCHAYISLFPCIE